MKVLVVDDSLAYRSTIARVLGELENVEIVSKANDGREAVNYLKENEVDVVTLDLEMPILDGIGVLKEVQELGIRAKIIVFASQTSRGAKSAMEAFKFGAIDVVGKPSSSHSSMEESMKHVRDSLQPKILSLMPQAMRASLTTPSEKTSRSALDEMRSKNLSPKEAPRQFTQTNLSTFRPKVVVIGSSTGGPVALNTLFAELQPNITCPILIAQHMPPIFTASLAKKLESLSKIPASEAKNGEKLENKIYVAPGDFHMTLERDSDSVRIMLNQGPRRNSVRPCVDNLFESAVDVFGKGVAGIVLTGMGYDGADGSTAIKEAGGGVFIQNEESCVVWGMPRAVFEKGAFDENGDLLACIAKLNYWTHPL